MTGYGLVPRWQNAVASLESVPCPVCGELITVEETTRREHIEECERLAETKALPVMTAGEARACIDAIIGHLRTARARILELYEREGWKALDYSSWRECVTAEFGQGKSHMYRQLAAAFVERVISPIGEIGVMPESHAREFNGLAPDEQKALAALSKAVLGKKPTASGIKGLRELSQSLLKSGAITVDGGSVKLSEALEYTLTEEQHERLLRWKQNIADAVEKKEAKAERSAARTAVPEKLSGESYRLIGGDFRSAAGEIADNSIDIILTDPPYSEEYLPLFSDLGAMAARVLRPGASLLVMSGELYLPEVMRRLCEHLTYHWTLAYLTPGGQSPQIWNRNINTFWKPVLWFVKGDYGGDWQGDVIKSERNEKDSHQWQQSESGMLELVKRFSLPDQLILDPFCGSGTTGVAAVQLHRRFIGIDSDAAAIASASERLAACPTP